jgi:alkylhydroperoxidase family enzyme
MRSTLLSSHALHGERKLRMDALQVHTVDTAPEASKPLLRALQAEIGFVPNMAAAMAESPSLLASFVAMRQAAADSTLSPVEREAVALATGVALSAPYPTAAHSAVLGMVGGDGDAIASLRAGASPANDCLALLTSLAVELARGGGRVGVLAEACLGAGLTPRHLYDVALVVAMATLVAHGHAIGGVAIDPQFGG